MSYQKEADLLNYYFQTHGDKEVIIGTPTREQVMEKLQFDNPNEEEIDMREERLNKDK